MLAEASQKIETFLHSQKFKKMSDDNKSFLLQIQNRIRAIHTTQTGWLKVGLIANYRAGLGTKPPSQKDLLEEAKITQEKSMGFSWIAVNGLLHDLDAVLKTDIDSNYSKILIELKKSIEKVQQKLSLYIKTESGSEKIREIDTGLFCRTNFEQKLIKMLGGYYFPFRQALDPLFGDSKGACHGHVLKWAREIKTRGYAYSLPRLDEEVFLLQNSQLRQTLIHLPETLKNTLQGYDIDFSSNLYPVIENIINKLEPRKLYEFGLYFYALNEGHAMGLRRIPESNLIELFDPNIGLVGFTDLEAFKLWLALHLSMTWCNELRAGGFMMLDPLGTQPQSACASIPVSNNSKSENDFFEELENCKQLHYLSSTPKAVKNAFRDAFPASANERRIEDIKSQLKVFQFAPYLSSPDVFISKHSIFETRIRRDCLFKNTYIKNSGDLAKESNDLKMKVIHAIQVQINYLRQTSIKNGKQIDEALRALILDIKSASTTISLDGVIKQWMNDKTFINQNTTIKDFIKNLRTNYEISTYRLNLAREWVIREACELAKKENIADFQDIIDAEGEKANQSLQSILEQMKEVTKNKSANKTMQKCYILLEKMDTKNAIGLEKISNKFKELRCIVEKPTLSSRIKNFWQRQWSALFGVIKDHMQGQRTTNSVTRLSSESTIPSNTYQFIQDQLKEVEKIPRAFSTTRDDKKDNVLSDEEREATQDDHKYAIQNIGGTSRNINGDAQDLHYKEEKEYTPAINLRR